MPGLNPFRAAALLLLAMACDSGSNDVDPNNKKATGPHAANTALAIRQTVNPENESGRTIGTRFPEPVGFQRAAVDPLSFEHYLRHLPLKPHGAPVRFYNGELKFTQALHAAVIDVSVGEKNLQQCADAVMRLRAEYLYAQKRYNEIHFNFVNGFRADYATWAQGKRIRVNGNTASWYNATNPSYERAAFMKYLEMVFSYAGTLSLAKEMKPVSVADMKIGDVFIQGGSPGHAVIVLDVAVDPSTGRKAFLLAQSFMPAQDIHVLVNPENRGFSPWFTIETETVATPEWSFTTADLKRFTE